MKKIAVITTHPIQYYAPLFRQLSRNPELQLKVFYTWGNVGERKFDPGFGKEVAWDIPLLEGYEYTFVQNIAQRPGSNHFRGIENPTLLSEVESWGAQAVLIFGWSYHSHWKAMRYFKGRIPVFFRGDSNLLDEQGGVKQWLRRAALSWIYRYIDAAFYVGTQNRAYYLRHGVAANKLVFVPHAIDNQRFIVAQSAATQEARELRRNFGIGEEDVVFLFAGKLEPKKNPLLLLRAFETLSQQRLHQRTHLIFVGNGVLEGELKQQAKAIPRVHFMDFRNQSQMPATYRLADVFVLPSQGPGETWGLAINEAMACGRVVLVSTKVGCAVDLVKNGENGYIFESNNQEDLVEKMYLLAANPDRLTGMGERSWEMIKAWSVEEAATRMKEGFLTCMKR